MLNNSYVQQLGTDAAKYLLTSSALKPQLGSEAEKSPTVSYGGDFVSAIGKLSPGEVIKSIMSPIFKMLEEEAELIKDINLQTGLRGELSEKMREDMMASSVTAIEYGVTLKEISEIYTELASKSGKLGLINQNFIDTLIPTSKSLNMTLKDYTAMLYEFENVGYGLTDTNERIEETITNSLKLGLSATKTGALLKDNIGKLNEYTFKNGYKGLEDMVKKSIEFKMEMATAFSFAEKVMDLDKTIEFVANMQMVGGAIGDLNDPLKLFYQANNDVEALQGNIINAAKSLAVYNEQQQRFEISGINLRRARDMAQQFGISVSEFNKIGIAALERGQALTSLMSSSLVFKNDEEKEFLINMSRMSKGQMVVNIPQTLKDMFGGKTEIALNELNNTQKEQLVKYKDAFEKMDIKDIAMGQYNEMQTLVKNTDVIVRKLTMTGTRAVKVVIDQDIKSALKNLKNNAEDFEKIISTMSTEEMTEIYKGAKTFIKEQAEIIFTTLRNSIPGLPANQRPIPPTPASPPTSPTSPTPVPPSGGTPGQTSNFKLDIKINGDDRDLITSVQRAIDKDPSIVYNWFSSMMPSNNINT